MNIEQHEHAPRPASKIDDEAVVRAAAIFRCAGDPGRLKILARLTEGELCVSELAEELGDSMSAISHRLRLLRAERLVNHWRDGKHVYYALADEHVGDIVRAALEHAAEDL